MCQPLILLLDDDGGSGEEGMNHRALSSSPCSQCLSWARQNACLLLVTLEQLVGVRIATLLFIVQLLNHVQLFAVTWSAACQVSISFTISWSLLKLMSVESVMPSNHLILCLPFSSCPQSFPASGCCQLCYLLFCRFGSFLLSSAFYKAQCTVLASHLRVNMFWNLTMFPKLSSFKRVHSGFFRRVCVRAC